MNTNLQTNDARPSTKKFKCAHCATRFLMDDGHINTRCEVARDKRSDIHLHPCCNDCYTPSSYNPNDGVSY